MHDFDQLVNSMFAEISKRKSQERQNGSVRNNPPLGAASADRFNKHDSAE